MDLSIVVPAFNEERRIAASLERIGTFLAADGATNELLVVDDGSSDRTAELVRAYAARAPVEVRLLQNGTNRGKGASVRFGMLQARRALVLFTDADLSAPIEEARHLLEPLRAGKLDVAIGSRAVDRTKIVRPQALPRDLLGRLFNQAIRRLTGLAIVDTQCGFKAFRRAPLGPLLEALRTAGFGFDVELLGLCQAAGLRLGEIPVAWSHVDGSKVRVLRDGLRMVADSAAFARRLRRREYATAVDAARARAIKTDRGDAEGAEERGARTQG
jgi:glycosyltransferase involved in cell wall biosynthesis